jgi:hypothetical protein
MTDPLPTLPPDQIDDTALPRDRTGRDPDDLDTLKRAILASGLCAPLEVLALPEAEAQAAACCAPAPA